MKHRNFLTPKLIWNIEQNKPSLVAKDLEEMAGVPRSLTHAVLLARGVYKWLAVRRDLIKLKNVWRDELSELYALQEGQKNNGNWKAALETKGRIKALEMCRKQVRALCHSERWRAPDFDKEANRFLEELIQHSESGTGLSKETK